MADTTKSDADTKTTKDHTKTKSDTASTSTHHKTKSSTTTPAAATSSYTSTLSTSIPLTSTSITLPSTQSSISTTPSPSSTAALVTAAASFTSAAVATLGSTAHNRTSGISPGATAAAAIVPIVVVGAFAIFFFFWFRRRRHQKKSSANFPEAGSGSFNSYGSSSQTSHDAEKQDKELEMSPMARTPAVTPITRRPVAVAPPTDTKSGARIAVDHHSPTSSDLSPSPPNSPDFTSYSPTPHHPSGAALLPPILPEVDTGNFFNDMHDSSIPASDPFDDPRPGQTPSPVVVKHFTPFGHDDSPIPAYVPFRPSHPGPPASELTPMPSIISLTHPPATPTRPGPSRTSTPGAPMSPADPDSFSLMSGPEEEYDEDAGVEYASAQVAHVVGAGAPARNRASVINMGQGGSVSDGGSPTL